LFHQNTRGDTGYECIVKIDMPKVEVE
jgi:hypothetical protein